MRTTKSVELTIKQATFTERQTVGAETRFYTYSGYTLREPVEWFLVNYRPPLLSTTIETAAVEFMRDREREVSVHVVVDYRQVVGILLNAAALEAGNSEAIIKKHYFNLVTPADTEKFWGIVPKAAIRPDGTLQAGHGGVDTIQLL